MMFKRMTQLSFKLPDNSGVRSRPPRYPGSTSCPVSCPGRWGHLSCSPPSSAEPMLSPLSPLSPLPRKFNAKQVRPRVSLGNSRPALVRWVTIPSSPPEETAAQKHRSLEVPQDTLKGILTGNGGVVEERSSGVSWLLLQMAGPTLVALCLVGVGRGRGCFGTSS